MRLIGGMGTDLIAALRLQWGCRKDGKGCSLRSRYGLPQRYRGHGGLFAALTDGFPTKGAKDTEALGFWFVFNKLQAAALVPVSCYN